MARILLVEDSDDVAQLMASMLQREGYGVDIACDGRKALDLLEKGEVYNLIITDLLMPNLDGVGLVQEVNEKYDNIPVIVISGGGVTLDSGAALSAVKDRVFAVMRKPVDFEKMMHAVKGAIAS